MANLFDGKRQRMITRIDDHEIVADAVHLAEMQGCHAFQRTASLALDAADWAPGLTRSPFWPQAAIKHIRLASSANLNDERNMPRLRIQVS